MAERASVKINTGSKVRDCRGGAQTSWQVLGSSEEAHQGSQSAACVWGLQLKAGNKGYRKDELSLSSHVLLKTQTGTRTFGKCDSEGGLCLKVVFENDRESQNQAQHHFNNQK